MSLKYIFIGGGHGGYDMISAAFIKNLLPEYAVICKEDDHENVRYSEKIQAVLKNKGVKFSVCKKLSEKDYATIKNIKPDLIILFGWRTIIDVRIKSDSKFGILAAHYSLLPKYRGFAPLQWAIINGEKETGVTLFFIDEGGVDSGKMLIQKKVTIEQNDYVTDVERKLTKVTVKMLTDILGKKTLNIKKIRKQNEAKATYTCKRVPEDGIINWSMKSSEIYNLIRALAFPYTGASCRFEDELYIIRKAEIGKMNNKIFLGRITGRVISITDTGVEVLCGSGTLKITEWEKVGTGKTEIPSGKVKSYSDTLK